MSSCQLEVAVIALPTCVIMTSVSFTSPPLSESNVGTAVIITGTVQVSEDEQDNLLLNWREVNPLFSQHIMSPQRI